MLPATAGRILPGMDHPAPVTPATPEQQERPRPPLWAMVAAVVVLIGGVALIVNTLAGPGVPDYRITDTGNRNGTTTVNVRVTTLTDGDLTRIVDDVRGDYPGPVNVRVECATPENVFRHGPGFAGVGQVNAAGDVSITTTNGGRCP